MQSYLVLLVPFLEHLQKTCLFALSFMLYAGILYGAVRLLQDC